MGFSPSTSTDLILRPTMSRSRSRRNTSISGSSGTLTPLLQILQTRPGDPRGRLLGFLLRIALARARCRSVEHHRREETLGVVGPLVTNEVARASESARRGELLEPRLVVAPTGTDRGFADAVTEI